MTTGFPPIDDDLRYILHRLRASAYEISLLVLAMPVLFIFVSAFVPIEQPRITITAYAAYVGAVLLLIGTVLPHRRWLWALLGIAAVSLYGLLIAPDMGLALLSSPSRRAGAMDWFAWCIIALLLPLAITQAPRGRWEEKLFTYSSRWDALLSTVLLVATVQGFASVIEPWVEPNSPFLPARAGLTANPGFLGLWCAFGALIGGWRAGQAWRFHKRPEAFDVVAVCLCAVGLIQSGAHAAWLAFAVGCCFISASWRARSLAVGTLVMGLSVASARHWIVLDQAALWRLEHWRYVVEHVSVWGHGWYSFQLAAQYEHLALVDFPHNLPLQIIWDLGLLGVILCAVWTLLILRLRGLWLVLLAVWVTYSLFWFPFPGWWITGVVLTARALASFAHLTEPEPIAHP